MPSCLGKVLYGESKAALNSKHLKIGPSSKVCGPYAIIFLNRTGTFEMYVGRLLQSRTYAEVTSATIRLNYVLKI